MDTHKKPSLQTIPWPIKISYSKGERLLTVIFDSNEIRKIPAEYLRVESPSAEVQGHHPSEKKIITGKENVAILSIEAVGNYAVRLIFDDGHKTGIYTWDYFYRAMK